MLSTQQIPQSNAGALPKSLKPGNTTARLVDLELRDGYTPGSKHVILHLESEPLGDDFEGFMIDKDNPSLGRYLGQIGRVKMSRYAFEDGTTKSGYKKVRNLDVAKNLLELAKALGKADDIHAIVVDRPGDADGELNEFFNQARRALLSSKQYLDVCLAGREYTNKAGYTDYDLFLPYEKGKVAYEWAGTTPSKVIQFDENKHIVKSKETAKAVSGFEPASEFDF